MLKIKKNWAEWVDFPPSVNHDTRNGKLSADEVAWLLTCPSMSSLSVKTWNRFYWLSAEALVIIFSTQVTSTANYRTTPSNIHSSFQDSSKLITESNRVVHIEYHNRLLYGTYVSELFFD